MLHDERTLRQVAELHASCIDQGFLSSLGPRFLTVLYRAIDRSDAAVLIVETDSTGVIGYVSGGRGMGPIYRQMLRDWPALIVALLPVLFKPHQILGIIEILRRRDKDDFSEDIPQHELFSFAVAQIARGTGSAERLYQTLTAYFLEQNVPAFRIVVGERLVPAHRFYTRMGAKPVHTFCLHGDSKSTVYAQNTS